MSSFTCGASKQCTRSGAVYAHAEYPEKRMRRRRGGTNKPHCANCGVSILDDSGLFWFLPCQHGVCSVCAYLSQVDRESNTQKCPVEGCEQYPTSSDYVVDRIKKKID